MMAKLKKVLHWGEPEEKKVESVQFAGLPFPLPAMYTQLKALPDDAPGQVTLVGQTENAVSLLKIFPTTLEHVMPLHNLTSIVDGIHEAMSDEQGLIEVNSCVSKSHRYHMVYTIVKRFDEEKGYGMSYTLRAHLLEKENEEHPFEILGFFEEEGTTGIRESMIYAMLRNQNKINEDASDWNEDPYDPSFEKGNRMNKSEVEAYDALFPAHPLSLCRSLVKFLMTTL